MGEIKKYDETTKLFGGGAPRLAETAEIKKLEVGEFWQQDHKCERYGMHCNLYRALQTAARLFWGKGNASISHRKGIIAGGHIGGYADHKHNMTAAAYCDKVAKRELYDSTLSFQLDNGFEVRGILTNYLEEPAIDNRAALIVWENPDYRDGPKG